MKVYFVLCFVFAQNSSVLHSLVSFKKKKRDYPVYSTRNMGTIHASFYPYRNVSEIKFAYISG